VPCAEFGAPLVARAPPRGSLGGVADRLAFERDRLPGKPPHPIEVGLAQFARRSRGNVSGICHEMGGPAFRRALKSAARAK